MKFDIKVGPLALKVTSPDNLPNRSKIVICSAPSISFKFNLRIKSIEESQELSFSPSLLLESPFFQTVKKELEMRMKELKLGEIISTEIEDNEVNIIISPTQTSTSLLLSSELLSLPLKVTSIHFLFLFTSTSSIEELKSQLLSLPLHPTLSSLSSQLVIILWRELGKRFPMAFDCSWGDKLRGDEEWWESISGSLSSILGGLGEGEEKGKVEELKERMKHFLRPDSTTEKEEPEEEEEKNFEKDIMSMLMLSTRYSPALTRASGFGKKNRNGNEKDRDELEIVEEEEVEVEANQEQEVESQRLTGSQEVVDEFEDLERLPNPSQGNGTKVDGESQRMFLLGPDDLFADAWEGEGEEEEEGEEMVVVE